MGTLLAVSQANAALVVFLTYTVAVFVLAALANRLLQTRHFLSEYFLGSRSLGVWAFALTFAATAASGGSFMGFPSKIYSHGWILALWIASYMVVPLCAMGLLAKRLNQVARISKAITVPDVLRERFESPGLGLVATVLIVFFMTVNLVAQFKAGSVILQRLLSDAPLFHQTAQLLNSATQHVNFLAQVDSEYLLCLLLFGVAVVFYTAYGGFHAVVWTDVLQGLVMVSGVLFLLPATLYLVGGLDTATEQMALMVPPYKGHLVISWSQSEQVPQRLPAGTWLALSRQEYVRIVRPWLQEQREELQRLLARTAQSSKARRRYQSIQRRLALLEQRPAWILFRTAVSWNRTSAWEADGQVWGRVEVVELVTADETLRQLQRLHQQHFPQQPWEQFLRNADQINPPGKIREVHTRGYLSGGDTPGVYVSGPGPEPESLDGFLPLSLAVSFFFMWAISGAGQPSSMVRLMAFRDSLTLQRSIFVLAIYYSLIYLPLVVIFCCARVLLPGHDGYSDRIMPEMAFFVTQELGIGWMAGLLIAAPFAAVMSTVDSFLLMISSALVRDVYQRNINPQVSEKNIKRLTYACTTAVGVAAVLGAVNPPDYLQDIIVYVGSGLAACFLAPVALAIFWPRVNLPGAYAGMLGGFGVHLSMYLGAWLTGGSFFRPLRLLGCDPVVVGLAGSLVAVVVVSLLTSRPPEHLVRKYFCRPRNVSAHHNSDN